MRGEREHLRSASRGPDHHRSRVEVDIQALICRPAFLVAVDAYAADRCSLRQMMERAFGDPAAMPRGLSLPRFTRLVIEIVRRIHAGDLSVPAAWQAAYRDFYREQPSSPRGAAG